MYLSVRQKLAHATFSQLKRRWVAWNAEELVDHDAKNVIVIVRQVLQSGCGQLSRSHHGLWLPTFRKTLPRSELHWVCISCIS